MFPLEVNGSMVRISGLFHLLINGVYWGYNPLILTIDPNFQRDIQELDQVSDIFDAFGNARRNLMQEICLLTVLASETQQPWMSISILEYIQKISKFYRISIFKLMPSGE